MNQSLFKWGNFEAETWTLFIQNIAHTDHVAKWLNYWMYYWTEDWTLYAPRYSSYREPQSAIDVGQDIIAWSSW